MGSQDGSKFTKHQLIRFENCARSQQSFSILTGPNNCSQSPHSFSIPTIGFNPMILWLNYLACKTISKLINCEGTFFAGMGLSTQSMKTWKLYVDRIGVRHLWQETQVKKRCLQSSAATLEGLSGVLTYTCTWLLRNGYSRIALLNGEVTARI